MDTSSSSTSTSGHQRFGSSASDEDYAALHPAAGAKSRALQHQIRSVRAMSIASVLLGLASVVMMASVVLRPSAPQVVASATDAVGLDALPQAEAHRAEGWYRSYLDAQVRKEETTESEKVDTLHAGSLVYVAELRGRRARILKPVKGWMSVRTADDIEILVPDLTYQASPNKTDIEAVFRSRKVREANERLQQSAMQLAAVEKNLMEVVKKMKKVPKHVENKMVKRWPQIADRAAKHVSNAAHKVATDEGTKKFLQRAAKSEHGKHIQEFSQKLAEKVGSSVAV